MTRPVPVRRPARLAATILLAFVVTACGDDDTSGSPPGGDAPATVTSDAPATLAVPEGTLPFDLGPGIVPGGDDVVAADGLDVPTGRFVDQIPDPPVAEEMEAHRLVPSAADEARVRAAAASLLDVEIEDVDFHVDGARFELHAEGHGHDDPPPTTVPPSESPAAPDVDAAVARTRRFLDDAGFGAPVGEPSTFDTGGFLSVEATVPIVPGVTVTRAEVSLTFDAAGEPIGGFGPIGEPTGVDSFDIVDVSAAVRRLELTRALSGYPTTAATTPTPPVVLVSAELVLALREVIVDGQPTGDTWLVPTYRFTDDTGSTWEVTAVVADALRAP